MAIGLAAGAAQSATIWAMTPWPSDFLKAYPAGAGGVARVSCKPGPSGELENCSILSEDPAGQGVGAAAIVLAPKFRLTQEAARTYAAGVVLPIRFEARPADPPWRDAAFKPSGSYRKLAPAGPFYPDRAARMEVSGEVIEDCRVEEGGRLEACKLVSVMPQDFGFEDAFAAMAQKGWMTAGPAPDGVTGPADGIWRFRVPFNVSR